MSPHGRNGAAALPSRRLCRHNAAAGGYQQETRMRSSIHGAAAAALLAALLAPALARADCTTTNGVVMELTGPAGEYGQKASKAVELAVKDINAAGGAAGCTLGLDIRD